MTPLGKKYKNGEMTFDALFENQMLLYTLHEGEQKLFPYRMMLEVLLQVHSMNYIEFLYSVYSAQAADEKAEIERAVNMVKYIRETYPNVMMTNAGNQEAVRQDLNGKHGMGFSTRDVWTDRTTSGNQYRFMINHMLVFDEFLNIDLKSKTIQVKEQKNDAVRAMLDKTKAIYSASDFEYGTTDWLNQGVKNKSEEF